MTPTMQPFSPSNKGHPDQKKKPGEGYKAANAGTPTLSATHQKKTHTTKNSKEGKKEKTMLLLGQAMPPEEQGDKD